MVLEESISISQARTTIVVKMRGFFSACGKKKAVLGLSGGIDSALVAALAVEALGLENVHGILMPSAFSTNSSVSDSVDLANNLGISYEIIPIGKLYELYMQELSGFFEPGKWSVAQENLQARIRGAVLMTYSNRNDALLLNTSNKSELFTGYGTLYGDLCGAMMVIADLYKMQVWEMSRFINEEAGNELIPESIINKAPSAELRPGQKDTDSLPAYEVLDPILHALHEEGLTEEAVIASGADEELVRRVIRLKRGSAFKVMQIPPVIAVGSKPIVPEFKCI